MSRCRKVWTGLVALKPHPECRRPPSCWLSHLTVKSRGRSPPRCVRLPVVDFCLATWQLLLGPVSHLFMLSLGCHSLFVDFQVLSFVKSGWCSLHLLVLQCFARKIRQKSKSFIVFLIKFWIWFKVVSQNFFNLTAFYLHGCSGLSVGLLIHFLFCDVKGKPKYSKVFALFQCTQDEMGWYVNCLRKRKWYCASKIFKDFFYSWTYILFFLLVSK